MKTNFQDLFCQPVVCDLSFLFCLATFDPAGSLVVDTSTLKAAFRQHSKFEEIDLDENNYQWHLVSI